MLADKKAKHSLTKDARLDAEEAVKSAEDERDRVSKRIAANLAASEDGRPAPKGADGTSTATTLYDLLNDASGLQSAGVAKKHLKVIEANQLTPTQREQVDTLQTLHERKVSLQTRASNAADIERQREAEADAHDKAVDTARAEYKKLAAQNGPLLSSNDPEALERMRKLQHQYAQREIARGQAAAAQAELDAAVARSNAGAPPMQAAASVAMQYDCC